MIEATGRAKALKPSQEATGKSSLAIWADSYRHSLSHTVYVLVVVPCWMQCCACRLVIYTVQVQK
jgi:hypothetical protein